MKRIMITNWQLAKSEDAYIKAILESSADLIIFREKWANKYQALELIHRIQTTINLNETTLIINHHHQLALEIGIINLHFSFTDYQSKERWIRSLRAQNIKCSVSIHNLEQLHAIDETLVDYLLVGTIFDTVCKPGVKTLGCEGLREIVEETELPVIAIGGIKNTNIHLLEKVGVFGIAQMGSYYDGVEKISLDNK